MATEKEILFIKRLLSEGVDELAGEWWINDAGDTTFADGDVGDYTHAMVAFEAALEISLEDPNVPEMIPMEPLSEEAIKYLEENEAPEEAIAYLRDGRDPREYAISHLGWIRVQDNNFEVYNFDDEAIVRIGNFLGEMLDREDDDFEGNIAVEEASTRKLYSVPAKMIMRSDSTADAIKHYAGFREEDIIQYVSMISEDLVPLALNAMMESNEEGELRKEYEKRIDLKDIPEDADNPSDIRQGLLFDKPGFSLRIREQKQDDDITYSMTCKFYKRSDEAEVEITKEMFDKLWSETIPESRMEKTRWEFHDWVIDDIRSPKDKKGIVAEIETKEEEKEIELPEEFEIAGDAS